MIKKRNTPRCVMSHMGDNRYLLKGTPDKDVIMEQVAKQEQHYILINVQGGNIRDLSGSIITIPGGYLAFKKVFEVNKRPAVYLKWDIAQTLLTAAKDTIEVHSDRLLIGEYEFTYAMGKSGYVPVGYVSLQDGKKLLHLPLNAEVGRPQELNAIESPPPISVPVPMSPSATPPVTPEPTDTITKPIETRNRTLSIISAIADDERNLELLKDIAYTAYSIVSKVKNSGAASKEEVAACIVAALASPETRSGLRKIGGDIFRRFKELNKEAGYVVEDSPGYRVLPNNEIALDEFPDADMMESIYAEMKTNYLRAHINYDRKLGTPGLAGVDADIGYIVKDMPELASQNQSNPSVFTFHKKYEDATVVYAKELNYEITALIMHEQRIFEVSSMEGAIIFGCFRISDHLPPLYMGQDGFVAEYMPACSDIYTVRKQYVSFVLDALADKVVRVADPVPDDIKALVGRGYKIGTEKKGEGWLLWAFPAGKTLNMPGLPKSIVGGVPQY